MPSRAFSTSKRLLTFAIAAGGFALLAALVFMGTSDPADYAPVPSHVQPDGETVGWVSKVEANTIHVNSGPFGGGVVALVVSRNTRITVGSKDGWFEDIRPGGQVKAAYDMFEGRRMARSVEILVDEGGRGVTRGAPRLKPEGQPAAADKADKAGESATSTAPVDRPPTASSTTSTDNNRSAPMPTASRDARTKPRSEPERPPAVDAVRRTPTTPARSGSPQDPRPQDILRRDATTRPSSRPPEPGRNAEGGGAADGSERWTGC
jgi:hypothetical protein